MRTEYTIGKLRGMFCIVWRDSDGKRRRYSLGTSDPREAERLAPAFYAELTRPKGKTVEELWQAYLLDHQGRAVLRAMKWTWPPMKDRFGPMDAERITIEDCRAHIRERRNNNIQDGTLHTELGHLRMVLNWAVKHGYIDRAPAIERPSKPRPKEDFKTKEEIRRLIDACAHPHVKLYVILTYSTGARTTALLELTWNRVDLIRGLIDLRNPEIKRPHKGRAIVPMNKMARKALEEAKPIALSPYVIEWAGDQIKSVKRGLTSAGKKADIGPISPHMIRHSSAVHMAEAGIDMEEISQFLGHANVDITRRVYARFSPAYLRNAANALEL